MIDLHRRRCLALLLLALGSAAAPAGLAQPRRANDQHKGWGVLGEMAGHAFLDRFEAGTVVEDGVRFVEWEVPGRVLSVAYVSRHGRKMVFYYLGGDGAIFGLWEDMPIRVRVERDGSILADYVVDQREEKQVMRRLGEGRYRTTFHRGRSTSTRTSVRVSADEARRAAARLYPAEFGSAATAPAAQPRPSSPAANVPEKEAKLALVIGIGSYGTMGDLKNPRNDARAIARTLKEDLTFQHVDLVEDATLEQLNRAVARFRQRLAETGRASGLFYFAGHGVQFQGSNFLLPADAAFDGPEDLAVVAIAPEDVLTEMQAGGAQTSVMVLDACRNVPVSLLGRGASRGFGQIGGQAGSYIAYATAPGDVAFDGGGENSPFTSALLTEIKRPGLPIQDVFMRVRRSVSEATGGRQLTAELSYLVVPFAFT